jgi:hypothetical protein
MIAMDDPDLTLTEQRALHSIVSKVSELADVFDANPEITTLRMPVTHEEQDALRDIIDRIDAGRSPWSNEDCEQFKRLFACFTVVRQ